MSNDTNIGAFTEEQASRLTGVSIHQLRAWDSSGFFVPAFKSKRAHVPFGRAYSFRDLVSLRVLNILRNQEKVPLPHLRKVSEKLSHLGDAKWTSAQLYLHGKKVVISDGGDVRREVVSNQQVFHIVVRVVIDSTKAAVRRLNERSSDVGKVERERFVSQNVPVIAGTRIPVAMIKQFAEAGYTMAQIRKEYPQLQEADVKAALEFKADIAA